MKTIRSSSLMRYGLILGLFFALALGRTARAQEGEHGGPQPVQSTPTSGTSVSEPGRMMRLAPPPTVASPTQADEGAQLYWLHCQPCHGDVGQGLTDEWRAQYPPEDQYCWNSGCHGERPYDNGFTLPFTIPAVIGQGTLTKFQTAGGLYHYIQVAMPFWKPASLTDEEYLAITAHLAQANGVWDGSRLTADNVDTYLLPAGQKAAALESTAEPTPQAASPPSTAVPVVSKPTGMVIWGAVAAGILILAGGIWLWQRSNH